MWFKNDRRSKWHKRKGYHREYAICNATQAQRGHLSSDNPPNDQRCKVCQGLLSPANRR